MEFVELTEGSFMKHFISHLALCIGLSALTACGGWDPRNTSGDTEAPHSGDTEAPQVVDKPYRESRVTCSKGYVIPSARPNTERFNLAQTDAFSASGRYVSNGDFIYSFPSKTKVNSHEANSLLLVESDRLYAIGKHSVTIYDISTSDEPQKVSQVSLSNEISGARIVGDSLVILSQSVIDRIEHAGVRVDDCGGFPAYTEDIYQTRITRMSLSNLEDDESISLIGAVRFDSEDGLLRFIEPGPKQSSVRRVLEILPDGQLGQTLVEAQSGVSLDGRGAPQWNRM